MSITDATKPVDLHFAEQHRQFLPEEFFNDLALVEAELEGGLIPEVLLSKGSGTRSIPGIRSSILHELHRLLCTEDPFYKDVRIQARRVSQEAAGLIGTLVAGTCGLFAGMVIGMVAFLSLAVMKIGTEVFCRRYCEAQPTA